MAIRHEVTVVSSGTTLTYSSSVSTYAAGGLQLQYNEANAISRVYILTYVFANSAPSTVAFTKMKLMCQLPNGTEFNIDNISVKKPSGFTGYGTGETGYLYADVPYDYRLNSQLGTTKCVMVLGTSSNASVAYARFDIVVTDASQNVSNCKNYMLDYSPATPPLNIRLSQYDNDFVFKFRLYYSQYESEETYLRASKFYLRGVRPDGVEVDVEVVGESLTERLPSGRYERYTQITLDGRNPDVGPVITEAPGTYEAAFYQMDKNPLNPKFDRILFGTQRLNIFIEKIE